MAFTGDPVGQRRPPRSTGTRRRASRSLTASSANLVAESEPQGHDEAPKHVQQLIDAAREASEPVKQLRLVTSFTQAFRYDSLVYDVESGLSHVWPHAWCGTFTAPALALQAAREKGLQPTAIFYYFGHGGEASDPHYDKFLGQNRPGAVELHPSAANTSHAEEATSVGNGHSSSGHLR